MDAKKSVRFNPESFGQALTFANLGWSKMKRGSHPDNGTDCLYLEADVREYSAFLVALTIQYRHADDLVILADGVQLQHTESGDTRFWLPGVQVRGV